MVGVFMLTPYIEGLEILNKNPLLRVIHIVNLNLIL